MPITEQQFQDLWRKYAAQVRAVLARSRLPDPAGSAEDIEQEVKTRLWLLLSGETKLDHTASYLRKVTNSAIIDAVRKSHARENSRREHDVELEHLQSPGSGGISPVEQQAEHDQLKTLVDLAAQQLPPDKRRATELRLQGLTVAEIARLTGWGSAKTRNLVYRGLAELRIELTHRGIDLENN